MTVHGGDVWNLEVPASQILDFSANINPRGLPPAAQARLMKDAADSQLLSFYPDPSARAFRNALAQYLACEADAIVVGPGAESLLAPILRYLQPSRALIPIPAFSEYRRVCAQEQVEFVPFPLLRAERFHLSTDRFLENLQTNRCDLALLNNPHNPTGVCMNISEIIANVVSPLIVDEAFIDYAAHRSVVHQAAARPGLIVLRSLTKFFGCPALRVGYAVAHPDTIRGISQLLPTWPITQLALNAVAEALMDQQYAASSLLENEKERCLLSDKLAGLGLEVFPSAANYLFVELPAAMPAASQLRSRLLTEHKILIRNCDSYEGLETGRYFRVAVRSHHDNEKLVAALRRELALTGLTGAGVSNQ